MTGSFLPSTALVTGANRGIGFEVCRQLAALGSEVFLGSRDLSAGDTAAAELRAEGGNVTAVQLDVTHDASCAAAAATISERCGSLSALVNNAGGPFDYAHSVIDADLDEVARVIDANALGPWRVTQATVDLLRAAGTARVVNLASEAGSFSADKGFGLTNQGDHLAGYGVAKATLNAVTIKLADVLRADGILVNAVSPGFVATQPGTEEMGGRPVPDGAASVVWGVTLPDDGPTGGFFRDGEPLAW